MVPSTEPLKVVHIITRMILGGAQENTLYTVQGLHRDPAFDATLITGPAIGPEGELIEQAKASGFRLLLVPEMRREVHPWRDLKTFLTLTRMLRELSPQIVHTHSSKAGLLGRMAARRAGVPVIIHSIHGQAYHENQNRFLNALFIGLERRVSRYTGKIISVADAMTDQAVAAGVAPSRKFVTIRSGMEVETFLESGRLRDETRARLGFEPDHVVVGKIARIAPLKGYEYLVEACADLVPRHPQLRFLFVGDGTLRPQIEAEAGRYGIRDRIVFTGLVPASQIPGLISAMDILAHASLREGLARVLPQALLSGKPAVSFDIDGAREVVIDDETGYLVEPKSVPGLIDAIERLAGDPARRERMGARGQELWARPFDKDVMVEEIIKVYREFFPQPSSALDPAASETDNRVPSAVGSASDGGA